MATFEFKRLDEKNFFVEGDLTLATLNKKKINSLSLLNIANSVTIDLTEVNRADSAGLAVLIDWIKQSKRANAKLTFKKIPHQLLTLANLSGVELDEYLIEFS